MKGPQGPREGGQGALRAPWGRAPSAPLGPIGAIGMIPKLFRMGCFSDTVKSDNGSRRFKGGPPGGRWDDFEAIPNGMFS